jgi:hypothetical protein
MNKWVWKIYQQKGSLWVRLLESKYMKEGDLFKSKDIGVPNSGRAYTR